MHHPTDRIIHTMALLNQLNWQEREIAHWVHPMKDRSDDPSHHERTLLLSIRCKTEVIKDSNKQKNQNQIHFLN